MKSVALFRTLVLVGVLYTVLASAPVRPPGMLWKITSEHGVVSYLFGTHHACGSAWFEQSPHGVLAWQNFQRCSQLITEVDADSSHQPAITAKAAMPQHQLRDFFHPAEYDTISRRFELVTGIRLQALEHFKPSFASGIVMVSLHRDILQANDSCHGLTMDMFLRREAVRQGKSCGFLETLDQQAALLFDSVSIDQQAREFRHIMVEKRHMEEQAAALWRAYAAGNLDALYTRYQKSPDVSGSKPILLDRRNKRWLPELATALQLHPTFVAVGALHLPGPNGLLEGLRQSGFQVEPVL